MGVGDRDERRSEVELKEGSRSTKTGSSMTGAYPITRSEYCRMLRRRIGRLSVLQQSRSREHSTSNFLLRRIQGDVARVDMYTYRHRMKSSESAESEEGLDLVFEYKSIQCDIF